QAELRRKLLGRLAHRVLERARPDLSPAGVVELTVEVRLLRQRRAQEQRLGRRTLLARQPQLRQRRLPPGTVRMAGDEVGTPLSRPVEVADGAARGVQAEVQTW